MCVELKRQAQINSTKSIKGIKYEWRARNFPDEKFPLSIFLYFCDHGIKSGLRPMLNCIFHTAISCWYAVSCIPKWTPYFLKNDSVTRIWFLIGLNLFRSFPYFSRFNLIWPWLTPNNPIMTKWFNQFVWCPWNSFVELSELFILQIHSYNIIPPFKSIWVIRHVPIWP